MTEPKHKNVHAALAAAQLEFGTVAKGSVNPAFKSKYADLADVASVVIPTLARHGVCVVHYLTGETLGAMRTEFVHGESDTRVSCDVPLLVDRQNMQGMKSATTYAKRIGLESLSGVAPEDDDGNAANAAPPPRREAAPPPPPAPPFDSVAVRDRIVKALNEAQTGEDLARILAAEKLDLTRLKDEDTPKRLECDHAYKTAAARIKAASMPAEEPAQEPAE
jgi:hypothetical protein